MLYFNETTQSLYIYILCTYLILYNSITSLFFLAGGSDFLLSLLRKRILRSRVVVLEATVSMNILKRTSSSRYVGSK